MATRVGARSSLPAASGPAASLRRSNAPGPSTRKRHGFVRGWLGAQRARARSSSRVAGSPGPAPYALCLRLEGIASSISILVLGVQRFERELLAAAVEEPDVQRVASVVVGRDQGEAALDEHALVDVEVGELGGHHRAPPHPPRPPRPAAGPRRGSSPPPCPARRATCR